MTNLINDIVKKVQYLVENVTAQAQEVDKLNGVKLNAIVLSAEHSNIAPIIYLDSMIADGLSTDSIALEVVRIYREYTDEHVHSISDQMLQYDFMKEYLSLRIINQAENRELLSQIPYESFLDLAVIIYVILPTNDETNAYIKVTNQLLEVWGVSFEDAYQQAIMLFNKEETVVTNMVDILNELGFSGFDDMGVPPLYVMTNHSRMYGASRILDTDVLESFAERMNADLVVIPSSTHEVLLLPVTESVQTIELMNDMVKEVNRTEVDAEERLSDHVYLYRKGTGWQ
ncbi:MAG: DUF5688 family protein [Lachnospiraceae bacterium]|nr:DUF5688 family protein [Lachnospiraceae bacterium]